MKKAIGLNKGEVIIGMINNTVLGKRETAKSVFVKVKSDENSKPYELRFKKDTLIDVK